MLAERAEPIAVKRGLAIAVSAASSLRNFPSSCRKPARLIALGAPGTALRPDRFHSPSRTELLRRTGGAASAET
jgi:hypothetical protein